MVADDACFVEFGDYGSDGGVPLYWPGVVSVVAGPEGVGLFPEAFRLVFVTGVRSAIWRFAGAFGLVEE